jgi:hypothetical protein
MKTKLIVNGIVEGVFNTKSEAKAQARKRMFAFTKHDTKENSLVINYEKHV